jgi:hypothetical protein
MTDLQILTVALAVIIPVSVMIYSNSRVSDLNSRISDLKKSLEDRIDNGFQHMELLLKLHEAEHPREKE